MSRASIAPSESRRTKKGSTVVAIGVHRRRIGRDNIARRRLPTRLGGAAEIEYIDGTFTKLPRCGTLRTSPVLDFQGGGCRMPLTEVKLLSLPVGTSKQPPPQLGERERGEFQVAG